MAFDEAELMDAAKAQTGLSDFGPEHFREGLGVLVRSLNTEAKLKPEYEPMIRYRIMEQLIKRLHMQVVFNQHPEILEEKIEAPICIIGSPRSGSSIMHEIWSMDPANRTPQAWEVWNPLPPPETATYHSDPRIAERQAQFDAIYAAYPELRSMHRMGATLPSEDVEMTTLEFASVVFIVDCYLPGYSRWLYADSNYAPVFESQKRYMQLLQWRAPGAPWVLKSLHNVHYMDKFLATFPDARVIWLHRDPLSALGSGAHLATTMTMPGANGLDPHAIARDVAHWSVVHHDKTVDIHEQGMLKPENVFHVHFRAFVKDHVAMVARIYEHFGMTLSPEAETRMREYVASHSAEQHGKHVYNLADMGLDENEYRQKFARYQRAFDSPDDAESVA